MGRNDTGHAASRGSKSDDPRSGGLADTAGAAFAAASLAMVLVAAASMAATDRPPNVIVIYADDQGRSTWAATGRTTWKRRPSTPWPRRGVRFTQFYAARAGLLAQSRAAC